MGAYEYAELIGRVLSTCEYLDPRPVIPSKIEIPKDKPNSFFWKEHFTFRDGKILKITDMVLFDNDGKMNTRNFMYDFATLAVLIRYSVYAITAAGNP